MDQGKELAHVEKSTTDLIDYELKKLALIERRFEIMQRKATLLAESNLIPEEFKGNVSNCSMIIEMADRLHTDPFLIARQIYFVHNRPALSTKLIIALLNRSGELSGRLDYEPHGEHGTNKYGLRAVGVDRRTKRKLYGPLITMQMAIDEGWYDRKGTKWRTLPELMLMYRAGSFFVSIHYPEILAGLSTADDLESELNSVDVVVLRDKREARDQTKHLEAIETIDKETGEIIEQNAKTKTPDENLSPPFHSLKTKLLATKTTDEINQLRSSPLFNKCTAMEKTEFDKQAKTRFDAIKAGLLKT